MAQETPPVPLGHGLLFQGLLTTIIVAFISPYRSPLRQKVNETLLRREGREGVWGAVRAQARPLLKASGSWGLTPLPSSLAWWAGAPARGSGADIPRFIFS